MSEDPRVTRFREYLNAEKERMERATARAKVLLESAPHSSTPAIVGAMAWLVGDRDAANVILSGEMYRLGTALFDKASRRPTDSQESEPREHLDSIHGDRLHRSRTVGCPYCSASHDPLATGSTLTCLKCDVCTNVLERQKLCPQCDEPTETGSAFYRRGQHV